MNNNINNRRTKGVFELGSISEGDVLPDNDSLNGKGWHYKNVQINCNGKYIAEVYGLDTGVFATPNESEDNATFIVEACNEHEKLILQRGLLLESLKMCINYVGSISNESEPAFNAWRYAKEAIRKCES